MLVFSFLIFVPLIVSICLWKIQYKYLNLLLYAQAFILSSLSIFLYFNPTTLSFNLEETFASLVILFDILLIMYFFKEGITTKNIKVWGLAALQLVLFFIAESTLGKSYNQQDFVINELSIFMFLVINIVGSLIIAYALWYIRQENISQKRERLFLIYLTFFLTVMNLIVSANSLMLFFFLFELTTLASYLLIGFRKDEIAQTNAQKALWMNQIGGVFILFAVILTNQMGAMAFFEALVQDSRVLIVLALLTMAALVKGAQMPFDSWLLGAMVAPTPVSAILHSATMVKIAPFMILKLSEGLQDTFLGGLIVLFGAGVFIFAGIYGLSKNTFKEILGYSTISLLGLMVAMAVAVGQENQEIVYILIFFHAISKALLFLLAGIVEKNQHFKTVNQMQGLLETAPLYTAMIMFGFATITLPPFGLFFAKLFSIEIMAENLDKSISNLSLLISLAVGSAVLTLLYFKVASILFSKSASKEKFKAQKIFTVEMIVPYIYTFLLLGSVTIIGLAGIELSFWYAWASLGFLVLIPLWLWLDPFKGVDRVKEYYCGEQAHFDIAILSFALPNKIQKIVFVISTLFFVLFVLGGLI